MWWLLFSFLLLSHWCPVRMLRVVLPHLLPHLYPPQHFVYLTSGALPLCVAYNQLTTCLSRISCSCGPPTFVTFLLSSFQSVARGEVPAVFLLLFCSGLCSSFDHLCFSLAASFPWLPVDCDLAEHRAKSLSTMLQYEFCLCVYKLILMFTFKENLVRNTNELKNSA